MLSLRRSVCSLALAAALLVSGCEKIVTIDLSASSPQVVIEAVVTDGPGPYLVRVTRTGSYGSPSLVFPPVSGARVTIADNSGLIDTLQEISAGNYVTTELRGVPGRSYTLRVAADGGEWTASSSMPVRAVIDSISVAPARTPKGNKGFNLFVLWQDAPDPGDYYRIDVLLHEALLPDSLGANRYRLYTDKFTNGTLAEYRVRTDRDAMPGDSVRVNLYTIDKAAHDYFRTLNTVIATDRSPTSLSPANPVTNLTNGALGYFMACTMDSRMILLK